jgi:methylated-DNA-protein-cysteine methyltransferase-like protein
MSDGPSNPEGALYARIYAAVALTPHGKVATYGDIAAIVGDGCDARTVGYALNEIPKGRLGAVPWQRIINGKGGVSTRGPRQRELLEGEGIVFDARGLVPLDAYRWEGPAPAQASEHGLNTLSRGADDTGVQLKLL